MPLGPTLMPLVLTWGVLETLWELGGLILEPLGSTLGRFMHPKHAQSGPGQHSVDKANTSENCRVFKSLGGWSLPRWYQSGILDAWIAHLGCLGLAGEPKTAQELRQRVKWVVK